MRKVDVRCKYLIGCLQIFVYIEEIKFKTLYIHGDQFFTKKDFDNYVKYIIKAFFSKEMLYEAREEILLQINHYIMDSYIRNGL